MDEMGQHLTKRRSQVLGVEDDQPGYDSSTAKKCLDVFATSFVPLTAWSSSTSLFLQLQL